MTLPENKNISLRKLRGDDWKDFRALRLQALELHPAFLLGYHDQESARPEAYWRKILDDDTRAVFGLFNDDELIGISGVFTHQEDASGEAAEFGMAFIEPGHRGLGLSCYFYEARIAWAKMKNFKRAVASHHGDNHASKRALLRYGFTYTHQIERLWPDGKLAPDIYYELKL